MNKVNYWKGERRKARTAIRNYVVDNIDELEQNYALNIPENIKNLSSVEFSKWIEQVEPKILAKKQPLELYTLLIDYHCACTNVKTEENGLFSL